MNALKLALLETVIEALSKPRTLNQLIALCGNSGEPEEYKKTRRLVSDALAILTLKELVKVQNNGDDFMYSIKPVNALELLRQEFPLNYQLATAPKPATLYNWDNAPDFAKYAVKGWWAEAEPTWVPGLGWGNGYGVIGGYQEMDNSDIIVVMPDSDSLEKRPEGK